MESGRTLELREHGEVHGVLLDDDQLRLLSRYSAAIAVRAVGNGLYDLRAAQHVGSIVLPRLRLVIRPKLAIRRLVYLLGWAAELARMGDAATDDPDADLMSVIVGMYGEALSRALHLGLISDYRVVADDLPNVKGRIDTSAFLLRRFGVAPPIGCTFDEYDGDTEPNRRMLAAALIACRAVSGSSSDRIRNLIGRFESVRQTRYTTTFAPLALDRRHARYAVAVPMAEMILRQSSIELRDGRAVSLAMLVDMNMLYERFVVRALGSALQLTEPAWTHHPTGQYLDQGRELSITPDAVWRDAAGRVLLIVDAKYKIGQVPTPADVYQIVSYCTALGATVAVLVYPTGGTRMHVIRRAGIHLHVVPLSVDGEPDQVMTGVRRVADALRAMTPPAG